MDDGSVKLGGSGPCIHPSTSQSSEFANRESVVARLRVLVSAYACEPGKGSEPAVGWNWVREIAQINEVWVITRANNRERIENELSREALPNVHWVYFDLPAWARFWKRHRHGVRLYYCMWQVGVYFVAKKLHSRVRFDMIHHVTLVNYWLPTLLPMIRAPFIWGPIGGGESAPKSFRRSFSLKGKITERLRDFARAAARFDPFVRIAIQRASWTFATTEETKNKLCELGCRRLTLLSQVALPLEELKQLSGLSFHAARPFRILSMGRLIYWKGFVLGLTAFADFNRRFPESEYWIIGDGPERKQLEETARILGVAKSVHFLGFVPRSQAWQELEHCHVLLHPSLHDSGGYVCLEAMAAGRPVICLDLAGPALQVTPETGIRIAAISPEQVIHDLVAALTRLSADPALCLRLGLAARRRVEENFDWNKKGEWMNRVYRSAKNGLSSCSAQHI